MRTAQIVKCKCGSVIAACRVPLCYEDREWQKDIRDFKDQGYTIDELPCDGSWHVGQCECADLPVNSFTKNEIRAAILEYCDENGMDDKESEECANDFISKFLIKKHLENKKQLEIQF